MTTMNYIPAISGAGKTNAAIVRVSAGIKVITHPLGTPRFDRFGRVQARVARMTSKGFAPLSRAVSIVVRTSASAFAAHMAR